MVRCPAFGLATLLAAGLLLAGCGGDSDETPPRASTSTTGAGVPALARAPAKSGELLFTGEASPRTHGPFTLDGRYVVRFEQFAPEDPKLDFSGQTPFTALLRRAGSKSQGTKILGAARATGHTEVSGRGRYTLEVSFGDFPYAVRFTPGR